MDSSQKIIIMDSSQKKQSLKNRFFSKIKSFRNKFFTKKVKNNNNNHYYRSLERIKAIENSTFLQKLNKLESIKKQLVILDKKLKEESNSIELVKKIYDHLNYYKKILDDYLMIFTNIRPLYKNNIFSEIKKKNKSIKSIKEYDKIYKKYKNDIDEIQDKIKNILKNLFIYIYKQSSIIQGNNNDNDYIINLLYNRDKNNNKLLRPNNINELIELCKKKINEGEFNIVQQRKEKIITNNGKEEYKLENITNKENEDKIRNFFKQSINELKQKFMDKLDQIIIFNKLYYDFFHDRYENTKNNLNNEKYLKQLRINFENLFYLLLFRNLNKGKLTYINGKTYEQTMITKISNNLLDDITGIDLNNLNSYFEDQIKRIIINPDKPYIPYLKLVEMKLGVNVTDLL